MKINWQQVVLNLRSRHSSMCKMAKELNTSYDTIKELELGRSTNPRYDLGLKLLDLHYDKCRELHKLGLITFK